MNRSSLLVAGLLVAGCGESEPPPLVPVVVTSTDPPALPPPPAASASSTASVGTSPPLPPLAAGTSTVFRVADLLANTMAPGSYLLEAYVSAVGTHCPPCPPRVVCSPCPSPQWFLADATDPKAPRLTVYDQAPYLASGARYRLRVEPVPAPAKGAVRIDAVLARLATSASDSTDDGCDACVSHRVEWGQATTGPGLGSLDAGPATVFALEPCRGFTVTASGSGSPRGCKAQMACSPRLTAKEIELALLSPDVKAALARAPLVFGRDAHARDASLLRIAVDGKEIFVGPGCDGDPSCLPVPEGVTQLASRLAHPRVVTDDPACGLP